MERRVVIVNVEAIPISLKIISSLFLLNVKNGILEDARIIIILTHSIIKENGVKRIL
jgi:hypothetical protein